MILKLKKRNLLDGLSVYNFNEKYLNNTDLVETMKGENKELSEALAQAMALIKDVNKQLKELNIQGRINRKLKAAQMLNDGELVDSLALDILNDKKLYRLPYFTGIEFTFKCINDVVYLNANDFIQLNGVHYKASATRNIAKLAIDGDFLKVDTLELANQLDDTNKSDFVALISTIEAMDTNASNLNTIATENKASYEMALNNLNSRYEAIIEALKVINIIK